MSKWYAKMKIIKEKDPESDRFWQYPAEGELDFKVAVEEVTGFDPDSCNGVPLYHENGTSSILQSIRHPVISKQ
jgi:hypothetical protein